MGPGCFHPRNAALASYTRWSPVLQWGRDVSIPEMFGPAAEYKPLDLLQWGRDVSIPEMSIWPVVPLVGMPRFNGAGMFPSQKWQTAAHFDPDWERFNGGGHYKGKEADRQVTRIDPGVVSLVAEFRGHER
jgi:hypothetical protein